jgi:FMN-dependent NADH-azoreductase
MVGNLLAADVVVIGTPMHNFAVPANLKAWIDQIVRVGRTFQVKPELKGLAGGKRVYVLMSALGFIGLQDITFVAVAANSGDAAA